MRVLAIETSCDETAAAIVEYLPQANSMPKILANVVWSQIDEHKIYGGVVPEIASRAHSEKLDHIIKQTLADAKLSFADLDAIAATAGPGLVGGLMIGLISAKALCLALNKPLIAVNHLEAHALTVRLSDGPQQAKFPYLLLLVSGGHTQLLIVKDIMHYQRLGSTIDDAVGEAFDKTGKLLGLNYPAGPEIEKLAKLGDREKYNFPMPLRNKNILDFSFSGLKTSVRNLIAKETANNNLNSQTISDICASFEYNIAKILANKVELSMQKFRELYNIERPAFVLAGGVAANSTIRNELAKLAAIHNFNFLVPPVKLCTDNAAMVAWAGIEHFMRDNIDPLDITARARWPLDETSETLVGFGKKGAKV